MGNLDDFVVNEPIILIFVGRSIGSDLSKVYPADVYANIESPGEIDNCYKVGGLGL